MVQMILLLLLGIVACWSASCSEALQTGHLRPRLLPLAPLRPTGIALAVGAGRSISGNQRDFPEVSAIQIPRNQQKSRLDQIARIMGYVLATGAATLYIPIIMKLRNSATAEGMSLTTWIMNVVGTLLAISYPLKRGFPLSTYVELTAVLLQGIVVLGMLTYHNGNLLRYALGLLPTSALYVWFIRSNNVPEAVVRGLQIASILVCTTATVPQILLTFQTGRTSWSAITASLSTVGCLVRVFTTLRLTKDRVALGGYLLGAVTNGVLLGQVLFYSHR